jgi:tetratricopeptide (TPR) repeat protein
MSLSCAKAVPAALVLLVLGLQPCRADISRQVPVGPRAIALGGAYSAIADDASAAFWNPAGLPWIGHQEIAGSRAQLFGTDLTDSYSAFVLPLSPRHAVALDWYHSGFEDDELDFGENRFDLAYGRNLSSILAAGFTVKYLNRQIGLDASTLQSGNGLGADLGVLVRPIAGLHLALALRDVFDTALHYDGEGGSEVVYPRRLRCGASYAFGRSVLATADLDDRYHLGLEVTPLDALSLRGGIQQGLTEDLGPTYSAGAGFRVGFLRFDYAYQMHPVLKPTSFLGLSLAFNFNPSRIRIEKVEARDLYASLYKSYSEQPLGSVFIRNLQDEPLETRLRVDIPELMDQPSEQLVYLAPRAVSEVPLTAVLASKALRTREHRPVQIEVEATYQSARLMRTDEGSGRCLVYGAGAISWENGAAPAAAFVTTQDPVIDALAREAVRTGFPAGRGESFPDREVAQAAAIVDALRTLGVTYVPDPHNAYSSISRTAHAVDTVQYPRETLEKRSGDCDDTVVLTAALLENVGIRTRFVDVPGHLFLLLDTGLGKRTRLTLAVDPDRYVIDGDRVWIPLETTAIPDGFAEAWAQGAAAYQSWSAGSEMRLVDVEDAQARYAPALLPGAEAPAPPLDADSLTSRLGEDARAIAGWQDAFFRERFGTAMEAGSASADQLDEMAKVYFLTRRLEEAEATLRRALELESSARVHNNLAAVLLVGGDVQAADAQLRQAIEMDPDDAGIRLNLGLVRYALGDTTGADRALADGILLSGGYGEAGRLLGLPADQERSREGGLRMSLEKARSLLKRALSRALGPEKATAGESAGGAPEATSPSATSPLEETVTPLPEGSASRPVPSLTASLAWSKAGKPEGAERLLYWKDE